MTFQKVTTGKMKMKNMWQIAAAKSTRSKKLHTQEVRTATDNKKYLRPR